MVYADVLIGQRVLEHCKDPKTQSKVMDEILGAVSMLAQDQYGNYVVQVQYLSLGSCAISVCLLLSLWDGLNCILMFSLTCRDRNFTVTCSIMLIVCLIFLL